MEEDVGFMLVGGHIVDKGDMSHGRNIAGVRVLGGLYRSVVESLSAAH